VTTPARPPRRGGKLTIDGTVVPPGTMRSRWAGVTGEERRRLALVALGELVLKVQQSETTAAQASPTLDV